MSINMNETVTGGSVTVEDGLKAKEEYAPARKIAITLNFSTPEGTDGVALLDYVAALANGRQAALLHGKVPAAEAPKAAEKLVKLAAKEKAPAKTKADLAKEAGLPTESTQHKGTTPPLVDELDDTPAPKTAVPAAPEDDGLGDLLPNEPKVVSDQELGKAAQEKNGKMKGVAGWAPDKIRVLVCEFVQVDGKSKPGAKIADIPQAKRQEFLTKLEALK